MTRPMFVLMPQWQGSPSTRAMQLAEGAEMLRDDLPASALREVQVPLEAGDAMGTPVARLSSLIRARDAARAELQPVHADGRPPIIVGGDCATSLPGLEAASRTFERLAVLWFDAHPDLQHPSTSPSGAASGMTLRHVLGDGAPDLVSSSPLDPATVTLVGARAIDPEEDDELASRGLHLLQIDSFADDPTAALVSAIRERIAGADAVYVHLDLDVLDPAEFGSVHAPVPFGLTVAQLTDAIRAAVSSVPLAGAAICEFAPADRDRGAEDLPTVLRILAALTSASGPRAAGSDA
ncbi:arginase family protein [Leucobacter japonicus]|uniref:arginase family protein n=1 Tax=Leucobacter japonicus TaxID=1461259 RepID=UPI0009499B6A|nr:arginase family protein [Leucobacter japonicus]